MAIIKEIEKVITKLPPKKASLLRFWLNEFKAARRYKQLKAYSMAAKVLDDFKIAGGDPLLN